MQAGAFAMPSDATSPRERLVDADAPDSERTYALAMHLSLLAIHVIGLPIVIPVILWLIRRHDSPFLDDHGKEAVNFQISLVLYAIAFGALSLCGVGIPFLIGVYVLGIVGCIMGAVAAHKGEFFRYPMCLRLL